MPKMKSHRGAAKRFKLTATGKIRRRQPNRAHLLEKKSSRRTRRLGRLAEVREIADAIVFLCSERASYVVGAAWSVDGGTVQVII